MLASYEDVPQNLGYCYCTLFEENCINDPQLLAVTH